MSCIYCNGTGRQPGYSPGPRSQGTVTYPCVHCWRNYGKKYEKGRTDLDFQDAVCYKGDSTETNDGEGGDGSTTAVRPDRDAGGTDESSVAYPFCFQCGEPPANEKCKFICRNKTCGMYGVVIENCSGD